MKAESGTTEVTTVAVTTVGAGEHAGVLAAADSILSRKREEVEAPERNRTSMEMYSAPPPKGTTPEHGTHSGEQQIHNTSYQASQQHGAQGGREEVQIMRTTRLRELRLPGMIGGVGENALSFSSLEFEVKRARQLGHSELEIVTAIIPKIADKELRRGCELEEDLELSELMDMLRSCTAEARDSSTVFAEFSHAAQKWEENESVATFVSRVFRLRKEILKLGKEEGVTYDMDMLKRQGFSALINGIRDENVRMGMREKCAGDIHLTRAAFLKHAADVVAVESERKRRLFPKREKQVTCPDINALSTEQLEHLKQMALNTPEPTPKVTKKKLNPFTEIEELRTQMVGEINEI